MNFWDTIAGYELANAIKSNLPEVLSELETLNQKLKNREQMAMEVDNSDILDEIDTQLGEGWLIKTSIPSTPGYTILVFEK